MLSDDGTQATRRTVLKSLGALGAVGVGAAGASTGSDTADAGWQHPRIHQEFLSFPGRNVTEIEDVPRHVNDDGHIRRTAFRHNRWLRYHGAEWNGSNAVWEHEFSLYSFGIYAFQAGSYCTTPDNTLGKIVALHPDNESCETGQWTRLDDYFQTRPVFTGDHEMKVKAEDGAAGVSLGDATVREFSNYALDTSAPVVDSSAEHLRPTDVVESLVLVDEGSRSQCGRTWAEHTIQRMSWMDYIAGDLSGDQPAEEIKEDCDWLHEESASSAIYTQGDLSTGSDNGSCHARRRTEADEDVHGHLHHLKFTVEQLPETEPTVDVTDTALTSEAAVTGTNGVYDALQRDAPLEESDRATWTIQFPSVDAPSWLASDPTPAAYPTAATPLVGDARPTDPDGDGKFEDIDGDGDVDTSDVAEFYDAHSTEAAQDDWFLYDFDGDGDLDVADWDTLRDEVITTPTATQEPVNTEPKRYRTESDTTTDTDAPLRYR